MTAAKRCPRCGQVKPVNGFYRRRPGGPSGYCRVCQRQVSRASRQRRMQDPASLDEMRARDQARKRRGPGGDAA